MSGGLLLEEAWRQIIIKLSYQSGRMVIKSVTCRLRSVLARKRRCCGRLRFTDIINLNSTCADPGGAKRALAPPPYKILDPPM